MSLLATVCVTYARIGLGISTLSLISIYNQNIKNSSREIKPYLVALGSVKALGVGITWPASIFSKNSFLLFPEKSVNIKFNKTEYVKDKHGSSFYIK